MTERMYSQRLGMISETQFQAALGRFIQAEPIPFGNFGQNVFVSSTTGEYVLRGQPHFWWQFPTEQFFSGFARRFPIYMLLDRVILWEFFQHQRWRWWPEEWTFRDWASRYISPPVIFDQL